METADLSSIEVEDRLHNAIWNDELAEVRSLLTKYPGLLR